MKSYGRTSVSGFLGDRIVYRDLQPFDLSLPRLEEIGRSHGISTHPVPRKNEIDYARLIFHLLQICQEIDKPESQIDRLVFIGDTHLLDGTAFKNLCRVSQLPGLAFIASEDIKPAQIQMGKPEQIGKPDDEGEIYLSNRWSLIHEFDRICTEKGQPIKEGTAVVIDFDKTAVGGRGRNGQVIDQARMRAVEQTVSETLGSAFDPLEFRKVYEPLNQPEYHFFTADNQDYLAYICLVLSSGFVSFNDLLMQLQTGQLKSFFDFISKIELRRNALPVQLKTIHHDIYHNVQNGDPTPFKAFRRNEYLITVQKFGCLDDSTPVDTMLSEEIVITQEVRQMAKTWKERGALLFGLSDKPNEASLPTSDQVLDGYLPLHRAETHAVGE